jgi:hypothetical protein
VAETNSRGIEISAIDYINIAVSLIALLDCVYFATISTGKAETKSIQNNITKTRNKRLQTQTHNLARKNSSF